MSPPRRRSVGWTSAVLEIDADMPPLCLGRSSRPPMTRGSKSVSSLRRGAVAFGSGLTAILCDGPAANRLHAHRSDVSWLTREAELVGIDITSALRQQDEVAQRVAICRLLINKVRSMTSCCDTWTRN